eukprot:m.218712 g.218712  ORF g.218712 m.218712 type:complete len:210 (-) comp16994_c4_seq1:2636-3265(-)
MRMTGKQDTRVAGLVAQLTDEEKIYGLQLGLFTARQKRTHSLALSHVPASHTIPTTSSSSSSSNSNSNSNSSSSSSNSNSSTGKRPAALPVSERSRVYKGTHVFSNGLDALDAADRVSRSALEDHGFRLAFMQDDSTGDEETDGEDQNDKIEGEGVGKEDADDHKAKSKSAAQKRRTRHVKERRKARRRHKVAVPLIQLAPYSKKSSHQ